MSEDRKGITFDEAQAAAYDTRFAPLDPIKGALHLVTRLALGRLPPDARVLCVGAGTGAEILYLAEAFPGWRFTAVDPSAPMLGVCRKRLAAAGVLDRCTLHVGRLDSLPPSAPFDGGSALLVSQFITDPEARRGFFAEIADRLKPGADFVSADIAGDLRSPAWDGCMAVWAEALRFVGSNEKQIEGYMTNMGTRVAVTPLPDLAGLIESAGFTPPTHVMQVMHIHAWHARAAS